VTAMDWFDLYFRRAKDDKNVIEFGIGPAWILLLVIVIVALIAA
jgi:hypothetical protein